jgi:predicted RND superfamily exporter protein
MGLLLTGGLSLALACNLVVLPALIEWRMRPRAR